MIGNTPGYKHHIMTFFAAVMFISAVATLFSKEKKKVDDKGSKIPHRRSSLALRTSRLASLNHIP